jgi:alkanesulfonate monooxygenase SsuD/methylene tetrahydromethanopterin reductase-like flavin-dependent oxidoreductase (luciferase family)
VPFPLLKDFRPAVDAVTAAGEAAGRDPGSMTFSAAVVVCCGEDEDTYRRRAAAIGRDPGELRGNGAAGTVAEVVERLSAFADAGAERLYLQVLDLHDLDHLRLIAAEVAPALP